jgi:hypothetical protein
MINVIDSCPSYSTTLKNALEKIKYLKRENKNGFWCTGENLFLSFFLFPFMIFHY